jgi:tetratricopeptide (TPR) repeat protein
LPFEPGTAQIAASRDGRVIAQSMYNGYHMQSYAGGWILSPGNPQPRRVEAGTSMGWCDVSPDGRWVAFGMLSESGSRVGVYEAATGRSVWQSTADAQHYCRFSSDGRWLLTDKEGGRAYAVDTWKPGPRLGPGIPWDLSPDGRLAVLGQTDGVYRLVERATGREWARLEAPDQVAGAAVFTANGTRLVVGAEVGLRVWDLRRIRAELVELGLDQDAPIYPSEDNEHQATPLEIKVDRGKLAAEPKSPEQSKVDKLRQEVEKQTRIIARNPKDAEAYYRRGRLYNELGAFLEARDDFDRAIALEPDRFDAYHYRGHAHEGLRQAQKAINDFSAALEGQPQNAHLHHARARNLVRIKDYAKAVEDLNRALELGLPGKLEQASACNSLAWIHVAGPTKYREPEKALPLARKAVELAPESRAYCHTLGVVLYRLGRYTEAVAMLERGLENNKGQATAFDLFFLAMCHHRQGDAARARECYDRALAWQGNGKRFCAAVADLWATSDRHQAATPWILALRSACLSSLDARPARLTPEQLEELNAFRAEAEAVLKEAKR